MTDDENNNSILDQIAEEVEEITHEQDKEHRENESSDDEDDWEPENFQRDKEEYDGGW